MVRTKQVDFTEVVGLYEHDIPSPECVHQELSRWKQWYVLRCIYGIYKHFSIQILIHQFALDCFLTCILKGNYYLYSYQSMSAAARPATPAATMNLKEYNPMHYPTIRIMLQLACSLHVTFCECECRSYTMRRRNTYIRTIMTHKILSSLALLHIHYDVPIDLDNTIDIYSRLHPRRLALVSLITP